MAKRYLLSIDGGGIRGIIPVCALVALERATGRLARETCSFVAGTSTGAIIAAGIASGMPAAQILDLYLKRGPEVFPPRPWNVLKRVVFGSMYSTQKLHDVLADALADAPDPTARGWRLNDSPIDLLITAKRVADGMPWYFVKDKPSKNSGRTGRLPLVDCVTASTAAPTYLRPWTIQEDPATLRPGEDPVGTLVDGGVGIAGNPVYLACVEAFAFTGAYTAEETTVVSLGTGRFLHQARPSPRWIWPWLQWVLAELLRSPGEQQTEITLRQYPQMLFYRIDTELKRSIEMDDVGSMEELRQAGEELAERIDWQAILDGTDEEFRVRDDKTLWYQYAKPA